MSLFSELRRRNVVRVGAAYIVLGWVLAQVAEFAFDTFGAPDWALKSVVIVLLLGLPLVLLFAWAFELTPDGIKRDRDVDRSQSTAQQSGRTLDRVIIAVLLIALAWFGWDRFFSDADERPATEALTAAPAAAAQKSIAVLPFVAMSSGPDDGYFADGLTEEILNSLSGLPELLVTARTSAFAFKGLDVPVQEIAATLNVDHIVEGSVRRSGNRLRVTAQLIRAEDGFHLWSDTYDRDDSDTFRIQTDIAEKIASALDVVLDDERRAAMAFAKVRNPAAFIAYQKGRELFVKAHGDLPQLPTLARANEFFDQAIELEPNFYHAYVARNDLYTHTLIEGSDPETDATAPAPEAVDEARRALEENMQAAIRVAPDEATRLNFEYDQALVLGNWRGLDSLTDAVLSQADHCVSPDWIHLTAVPFGRAAEAVDYFENLVACDPLGDDFLGDWATAALWSGQFERVIESAGARTDSGQRQNLDAYVQALVAAGRLDEAEAVTATEVRDAGRAAMFQALIALKRGDADGAPSLGSPLSPNATNANRIIRAARLGDRVAANDAATAIDRHPYGYIRLLQVIYFCNCGAPFDLEATPALAALLDESGLSWPPAGVTEWPLKDW
ncbi:MAG: hypothetical protein P8Y01_04890 [Woeseiaceae bacterium]|jgi:adenylate cyclase